MYVTQLLHRRALQNFDRVITTDGQRVRTTSESLQRISKLAGGLRSLGVTDGDRVGMIALNSDRYHEYLLAVPWAGGVVNPVNTRWSVREIAYSLVDCDTRILFVDDGFLVAATELKVVVPNLDIIIYCGDGNTPSGMVGYEQLIEDSDQIDDSCRGGENLYGIFYTGGTTGAPKGVMLSHDSMLLSALSSLATTDLLTRDGRLLHAAPMFHLADIAAWLMGLIVGSENVFVPSFAPLAVAEAIRVNQVTDVLLVPTMIQMLVDSPDTKSEDYSSLQRIFYGASPISQGVLQRARACMKNARFTQAYGMTELAPVATLLTPEDHDDPDISQSAGRAAVIDDVRIEDVDGSELPAGEIGEIVVRGDNVMLGYWNRPEETAQALRGGWMHTGDGGYMDSRGYVFVVDRLKDMIITGGENVYSIEVENALSRHPLVASCAVIGVPDEKWGERVHAVVVLMPNAKVSEEELREYCRDQIANYKIPRSVAVVDALPVSGAGKVLKRQLRLQQW